MKRREFLKWSAVGGLAAGCGGYGEGPPVRRRAAASLTAGALAKFAQPIIGLGPSGIPVLSPDTGRLPGVDFYEAKAADGEHLFHPQLPKASRYWGYSALNGPQGYLGGVIVAQQNRPVLLRVHNRLSPTHPLPVDTSIAGAGPGVAQNRISVHLHGGLVPWNSDGNPMAWFGADGSTGCSFLNPARNGAAVIPNAADYWYPNQQSARLLWYHDHAMGLTRLNAYAGLATAYLLRDPLELASIKAGLLPSNEIPLVLQDKSFVTAEDVDAGYAWGEPGDLFYPWQYDAEVGPAGAPLPVPSCVPEFFGDYSVVNGAVSPFVPVEQRHYRFRILNGSQARVYNLQLYYADGSGYRADLGKPGPAMVQIGTEGGFLPFPVLLNAPPQPLVVDQETGLPTRYTLLLAPGERADVVIDFGKVPSGSKLILFNDATAPFPMGDAPGGSPGASGDAGPDAANLLQFIVQPRQGRADPASLDVLYQAAVRGGPAWLPATPRLDPTRAARARDLVLFEDFDGFGRLIQRLGTLAGQGSSGRVARPLAYEDAATETPRRGEVEVWNVYNLTGDVHPIHLHLVNFQGLSRRPFALSDAGELALGPARPVDANEAGWKETLRMNPGECTTVIARFDLPVVPFKIPLSPLTGGHDYVWHCHILEHEEHDMMRPLVVRP